MHYYVTGDPGQLAEARLILGEVEALDIDLPEIQTLDSSAIVKAKLAEARKHHQGNLIVDAPSLHVAAWHGLPGPFIRWFHERLGNVGLYEILRGKDDRAEVQTVLGYLKASGQMLVFEAKVTGRIVPPRGNEEHGWDTIFMPDGHDRTFAEMKPVEKINISTRGQCLERLRRWLKTETWIPDINR